MGATHQYPRHQRGDEENDGTQLALNTLSIELS
jgi:hypothetical protein